VRWSGNGKAAQISLEAHQVQYIGWFAIVIEAAAKMMSDKQFSPINS